MATTKQPRKTSSEKPAGSAASLQRGRHYALVSIEQADAPDSSNQKTWYRYIVQDEYSTITGMRCGSLKEVTEYAHHYAQELNTRNGSTSSSPWASRQGKTATSTP